MGSCIICGSDTEGRICDLHEEDVVFEFRGSSADELTTDRYYRGTVDGYADFGVFVDIGDSVTGLLHRSELDQRLDSLDWEPGDTVFVQVKNVRDNGNVDLAWSIRQGKDEFRGTLVHDPNTEGGPTLADTGNASEGAADGGAGPASATPDSPQGTAGAEESTPDASSDAGTASTTEGETASTTEGETVSTTEGETAATPDAETAASTDAETAASTDAGTPATSDAGAEASVDGGGGGAQVAAGAGGGSVADGAEGSAAGSTDGEVAETAAGEEAVTSEGAREPSELTVDQLPDNVGEHVRLEGEIVDAHQTSGPTVFTLRDETGTVECAAFESAGVRAYPEVGEDDVVRLDGLVERRRGDLQVETEALVVLEDDEREAVADRLEEAMLDRARPEAVEPLAEDPAVEGATDGIRDVATAIRRAIVEGRPVVVRHSTTTDGYAAGVALERATLPLVREEHLSADAEYHYFDRRPLEGSIYDLEDATKDVTSMLSNRERHDEALPLFVFVGVGGSPASLDAFDMLDVYDARRVLIDDRPVDEDVAAAVDTVASPDAAEGTSAPTTATALAATTAAAVNAEVVDDVAHLPAVSFWEDAPSAYVELASDAGFDEETVRNLREAVALEAFYQSYEDKRELVIDLLFPDEEAEGLASRVSGQFREKIESAVETAEANLEAVALEEPDLEAADLDDVDRDGGVVLVLDTAAYTHRYEFPPVALLLDELWRRNRNDAGALLGLNTDEGHLRTDADVEVGALVNDAAMAAPRAGVELVSHRDGEFEYLAGEREDARDAVLEALGDQL